MIKGKIFMAFFTMLLFLSCAPKSQQNQGIESRIKQKDWKKIDSWYFTIIEIDGVEYISQYQGGICPLVNQKEKK